MSDKTMKIGLFGGTFDPIHIGHLFLAEAARDKFRLDKVLFLPTPVPYHRGSAEVTPLEDRVNMTRLAIADNPWFEFSDAEINIPGNSYTSKTLEFFHEKYPDAKLFFILGGDSLFSIEFWKNPERIFELATVLSCKRKGQQNGATGILHADSVPALDSGCEAAENTAGCLDKKIDDKIADLRERFGAEIYNLYVPEIEISSSDIKARVKDGRSIRYCTPQSVAEYIYDRGLYSAS